MTAGTWLRWGCIGCGGLIVLLIAFSAVVTGLAWFGARSEQVEDRVLTGPEPKSVATILVPPVAAAETGTPGDAAAEAPGHAWSPGVTPEPEGVVELDLRQGEFQVRPADPGEPLRVEANYDTNSYELEQYSDAPEDGPWTYRVGFRRTTRSGLVAALKQIMSGHSPRVRVWLPRDVALRLDLRFEEGGGEVDLGGLAVTEADLRMSKGGGDFRIPEPGPFPMEHLRIEGRMGGGSFTGIGNASPKTLDAEFRMGGVNLDLRGAWQRDAEIRVNGSMGGAAVIVPSDVRVIGAPGRVGLPEDSDLPAPTLRLDVSWSMGEVEIVE